MEIHSLKFKATVNLISWLLSTYKFEYHGVEPIKKLSSEKTLIFSGLHGHIAGSPHFVKKFDNVVSIASRSDDGELAAEILKKIGFKKFARGSSSKHGVEAVLDLIRNLKEKAVIPITVDGPKGPRLKVKPGAIYIAKYADNIIIPAVINCKRYIQFNSWDKMIIPYPFSKINIYYGKPFYVSEKTDKRTIVEETRELEKIMRELAVAHSPNIL